MLVPSVDDIWIDEELASHEIEVIKRARGLEEVCSVFELLLPLGFVKFCLRGRDW